MMNEENSNVFLVEDYNNWIQDVQWTIEYHENCIKEYNKKLKFLLQERQKKLMEEEKENEKNS